MQDRTESRRYAIWFVAVLIVAYTFSYIDRTILTLMVKPIRASLQISDVQLSLLHGLAFALFYTFMGIPIGRLVDRYRRTTIVAIGVAIWSLATALCGFAATFGMMFAARVLVGIGESTLSPAAYSMLADKFSGKKLVRALAFYQSAIYLGPAIATFFGGVLLGKLEPLDGAFGHFEPWQLVFVLVGLPGLLIALLVVTLREPARQGAGAEVAMPSFPAVLAHMRERIGAYGLLILGLCLQSIMWNGTTFWIPEHLKRAYNWTSSEVAWSYGPVIAICGVAGGLTGGWLAGWLRDKGRSDSNVLIGVIAAAGACPFAFAAPLMPSGQASLVLIGLFLFMGAMPYGGAAAAFQEITPNRMRGQVSAVYLFWLNLAGIGTGPIVVAFFTDYVFHSDQALGYSLACLAAVTVPLSALFFCAGLRSFRSTLAQGEF